MCLIKGRQDEKCLHHWCVLAAKQPQYWSDFKSDYIMNEPGLQSFKLSKMLMLGTPYILPVNPFEEGTKERNKFEIFRQAMGTHTDCIGYWPSDRDTFDKSEVEFLMVEVIEQVPESGCYNEGSPLVDRPDLKEVAIYIGEGSIQSEV
jgi:hypothetical protein